MIRIGVDARLAYHRQAGITRYTRNLCSALRALNSGDRFTVFHHRRQPPAKRMPTEWRHRTLFSPVHHAWEQAGLALELSLGRWDVVHFPDFIGPLQTRLPTVITVHDLAFLKWPEVLTDDAAAYYGQLPRAVRHAAGILVPSRHTAADLAARFPEAAGKTTVVPHAVDPGFLQDSMEPESTAIPKPDWLPDDYLLHVGTLEPRKNIATLLTAFAMVHARPEGRRLKLVLAGASGWLQDDMEEQAAKRGIENACVFAGQLSEPSLAQAYRHAKCLVHPALYEGFGFTLLEAMASGTPVVCSNASCLPEIAGNAALTHDPGDPEAVASNVLALLNSEELASDLVNKGHKRVLEFSWEKAARQTLNVYRAAARQT
ncbi:MAG: glycosyltransferase family 1 protein [Caldilineaceae bacterium]|nr:glycosyltransferase family 1 protein [Caldilineaceae bacterium]